MHVPNCSLTHLSRLNIHISAKTRRTSRKVSSISSNHRRLTRLDFLFFIFLSFFFYLIDMGDAEPIARPTHTHADRSKWFKSNVVCLYKEMKIKRAKATERERTNSIFSLGWESFWVQAHHTRVKEQERGNGDLIWNEMTLASAHTYRRREKPERGRKLNLPLD